MKTSEQPNSALEMTDDEAAEGLLKVLRGLPDPDAQSIVGSDKFSTVSEMIEHVENRTPAGMELIELHKALQERLENAELEKKPGLVGRFKAAVRKVIS